MYYVRFHGGNGYCGCDYEEVLCYDEEPSEEELMETSETYKSENAESYAYLAFGWEDEYTDEEYESYLEDCEAGYEFIDRDEYLEYCENYGFEPEGE